MKKFLHYFNDLFKRFDLCFLLLFIFLVSFAFYCNQIESTLDANQVVLISIPIFLGFINLGNFKKSTNLADALSIIVIFTYIYFAMITPIVGTMIYCIVMAAILFCEILFKAFRYENEEPILTNASKSYFSRLNYRFPLAVLIFLGFATAFCMQYVITNMNADFYAALTQTTTIMSSILISLLYLSIVHFLDSKYISILDYVYFVATCFLCGMALFVYPRLEDGFPFFTMLIPFLTLFLRAYTFEGETIQKKRKYISLLLEKNHVLAPVALAFAACSVIVYTSYESIMDLHQNIFLLIFSIVAAAFTIALICMKNLKSKEIKAFDYILLMSFSLLFMLGMYILAVGLGFYGVDFRKTMFSDLFSLIGIFVLFISLLANIVIYTIRYRSFFKEDIAEKGEEEIQTEEIIEVEEETTEPEEVEIEEEDILLEASEPIEDELEEIDDELTEPALQPVDIDYQVYPTFIIPEDESQNHLTKLKYLSKLMFADEQLKQFYSEIKNELLSYDLTSRIAGGKETFKKKDTMAVIKTNGKSLTVYLAILPDPFIESGYPIQDLSQIKEYSDTPCMFRIKTKKSVRLLKEIIQVMMTLKEISKSETYIKQDFVLQLIPSGEAILNGLGYSSDNLVSSINAKILPYDMPKNLVRFIPMIQGQKMVEEINYTPVYLDMLCNYFEDGDITTKEILIQKKLIRSCFAISVKPRGTLDKRLTIYADDFDGDALQMIYITGGTAVLIKHD